MRKSHKPISFWIGRSLLYVMLIGSSILMVIPFYWSLATSLKLEQFVYASPPQWWPSPASRRPKLAQVPSRSCPKTPMNCVPIPLRTTL